MSNILVATGSLKNIKNLRTTELQALVKIIGYVRY